VLGSEIKLQFINGHCILLVNKDKHPEVVEHLVKKGLVNPETKQYFGTTEKNEPIIPRGYKPI
jgi:hypothetical protein